MQEEFELEIIYKNQLHKFPGVLRKLGYTYKIFIDVNGSELIIEPDEEGNFRSRVELNEKGQDLDPALVKVILEELEKAIG